MTTKPTLAPRAPAGPAACAVLLWLVVSPGCSERPAGPGPRGPADDEAGDRRDAPADASVAPEEPGPCVSGDAPAPRDAGGVEDIPRYAADSPFAKDPAVPEAAEAKRIWAASFLWAKAPELLVETWLTDEPRTEGKYVLIEFWNTWCPACRRSIDLMNRLHERFGSELVVIGVCDETEADVRAFRTHEIRFFSAIDTQARTKRALGVFGVPHAVVLEPEGYVVWEGYPLLKGYELTEEKVEKILAVGRRQKAGQGAQ